MHFKFRDYQFLKTKKHLKSKFLIFSNGVNQTSKNWLTIEQSLSDCNLNYYKIYNKIALKVFKNSLYKNTDNIVKGAFFFLKLKNALLVLNKQKLFKSLEATFFTLLSIKLNNKIYSAIQVKNMKSLNYKNTMTVFYQFLLVNLKHVFGMKR